MGINVQLYGTQKVKPALRLGREPEDGIYIDLDFGDEEGIVSFWFADQYDAKEFVKALDKVIPVRMPF